MTKDNQKIAPEISLRELDELMAHKRRLFIVTRDIQNYENGAGRHQSWDIVKESRHDIRATVHAITVQGTPQKYIDEKLEMLYGLYWKHKEIADRVEGWIGQIDDLDAQSIFKLRYIDGLSFKEIANLLWPDEQRDESYPRKCIHDKYLREHGIT